MADVEDAASRPDLPFAKKNQAAEAGAKRTPPPATPRDLILGAARSPRGAAGKASGSAPVPTGPGAQKSRLENETSPTSAAAPPQATPGVDKIDRLLRPGVLPGLDTGMQQSLLPFQQHTEASPPGPYQQHNEAIPVDISQDWLESKAKEHSA